MCDYSLMAEPNRLAREGEELVFHRFPAGTLGLASPADLRHRSNPPAGKRTFWTSLKELLAPPEPVRGAVCAICIPPGARLELRGLPPRLQLQFDAGPAEHVVFTQLSAAAHSYRDAIRFPSGCEVRLQDLCEGLRVKVLDLSLAEDLNLERLREERADFPMPMRR